LYIPLGGNKKGRWKTIQNTVITFLVSGLWHGAHLKYLAWGGLHALYMVPLLLRKTKVKPVNNVSERIMPGFREGMGILFTFLLVVLAWILFRSNSMADAVHIFREIFSMSLFTFPEVLPRKILLLLGMFIILEWLGRHSQYAIEKTGGKWPSLIRWGFYYLLILLIFLEGGREQPFIYFQF
jgi:D-alanyl-lipoteichoic acid acyltransferase DltB (MBOAT superfamily)